MKSLAKPLSKSSRFANVSCKVWVLKGDLLNVSIILIYAEKYCILQRIYRSLQNVLKWVENLPFLVFGEYR